MNQIDNALNHGVKRRYWQALIALPVLTILTLYLCWLFLTTGFTVKIYPEEAAQSQQFSVSSGVGFFIDNSFYMIGSKATITAGANKFTPKELEVLATSNSNLSITLTPLPAKINLVTDPQVTTVNWKINDQVVSTSASLTHKLEPGIHKIVAEHPAYQPASIELDLAVGEEVSHVLTLTPVKGDLVLASRPTGADILIDGNHVGKTPTTITKQGGTYQVEIRLAGYEPVKDNITLKHNALIQQRDYFLKPEQALLTLEASPANGILMLNGKPSQNPVSLDAGKAYTIRYEKPGYVTRTQQLTLQAGEKRSLKWQLEEEKGQLELNANVIVDVFINGKPQGKTPLKLSLQTVAQQVEFRKTGYRSVTRTVTPSAKKSQNVKAEMMTEFATRRLEGKPLFAETLGFSFIGIRPKSFTMGSPDNEQGRMRNEHQIKVDFSRSIYVSKHHVTEAQFAAYTGKGSGTTLPVTQISWLDAVKFTNWLSEQEGLIPFYILNGDQLSGIQVESQGYRLLTEAEWEFIAKHNGRSLRTTYVWGNSDRLPSKQGNFADKSLQGKQTFLFRDYEDGFAGKAPVGSFKADRAGFFDLDGNVREWVNDYYALNVPDLGRVNMNYMGVSRGQGHVVKGASFKSGRLKELRASVRSEGNGPEEDVGFRIARFN